jgi:hypothetical protein
MNCFFTTGEPCALKQLPRSDSLELHMIVNAVDERELERFRRLCRQLSLKPVVLAQADAAAIQPMACSRVAGPLATAQTQAQALQAQLEQGGFRVSRVKIEAAPWSAVAPAADPQLSERSDSRYFEYQARLLVPATADELALAAMCRQLKASLSRTTHVRRADGYSERFVTLRSHTAGRETFAARARDLALALATAGYVILASAIEYCVYDSNLRLDAAWFGDEGESRERYA